MARMEWRIRAVVGLVAVASLIFFTFLVVGDADYTAHAGLYIST